MSKIQRTTQKIFGGNALADDIAALGSFKTGTPVYTDDLNDLQNAAYEEGFGAAIVANEAPFLEEQNSIPYILSKQLAYLFQEGIAEYDVATTYYTGSVVKAVEDNKVILYQSLTDENSGNPLTDETNWEKVSLGANGTSLPLFTPVTQDHILSFEESKGLALQGTYVYKTGITGSRYGYPDFVQKCFDEKTAGTATQVTLGDSEITMYVNPNGHQFYDIADKEAVDAWFATWGIAWFYGVDTENQRVFLPRRKIWNIANKTIPVVGNGYTLGITDGSSEYSMTGFFVNGCTALTIGNKKLTKLPSTTSYNNITTNALYGVSQIEKNSGLIAKLQNAMSEDTDSYLYIVVGNTSEITNVTTTIPSDEIISQVNQNTTDIINKVDLNGSNAQFPIVVDSYENGKSGYVKFSNGLCIQWGNAGEVNTTKVVNLFVPFKNISYTVLATPGLGSVTAANPTYFSTYNYQTNNFTLKVAVAQYMNWFAIGYAEVENV